MDHNRDQLEEIMLKWQKILRLQDYDIKLKLVDKQVEKEISRK